MAGECTVYLVGYYTMIARVSWGSVVMNPPANVGDVGLISGSEDSLEKEIVTHSSSLPWKIRGTWKATVPGVT